jgi:hypothetical protein
MTAWTPDEVVVVVVYVCAEAANGRSALPIIKAPIAAYDAFLNIVFVHLLLINDHTMSDANAE